MLQSAQKVFAPSPEYVFDDNQKNLAQLVGYVGLLMPVLLLVARSFSPNNDCSYNSISHHYYAFLAGDIFVGSLFVIAAIVIFYKGKSRAERWFTTLAGIFAIGVAIFPTDGSGCEQVEAFGRYFATFDSSASGEGAIYAQVPTFAALFEATTFELTLFGYDVGLHYASAGLLFILLGLYCVFIFPQSDPKTHLDHAGEWTADKRRRNLAYYISATVIFLSIFAIAAKPGLTIEDWDKLNLTFWFETFGLAAFGFSWLVRGRFIRFFGVK